MVKLVKSHVSRNIIIKNLSIINNRPTKLEHPTNRTAASSASAWHCDPVAATEEAASKAVFGNAGSMKIFILPAKNQIYLRYVPRRKRPHRQPISLGLRTNITKPLYLPHNLITLGIVNLVIYERTEGTRYHHGFGDLSQEKTTRMPQNCQDPFGRNFLEF